jgi:hypothetical protein
MDEEDPRFARLGTEHRFRGAAGQKQRKVKIDKRFQSLFTQVRSLLTAEQNLLMLLLLLLLLLLLFMDLMFILLHLLLLIITCIVQEKFVSKCSVDKRGRPKHLTAKENYERFYDLDSSEEESDEESERGKFVKKKPVKTKDAGSDDEDSDEDHSDDEDKKDARAAHGLEAKIVAKLRDQEVDYARGEAGLYSSDSR